MDRPVRMVGEWKQMVKEYLSSLKLKNGRVAQEISDELGYYVAEGRRIKEDL